MEFAFGQVCYDVFISAISDGKTQDTQGHFIFSIPLLREIVKSYFGADVTILVCRFWMQIFLFLNGFL